MIIELDKYDAQRVLQLVRDYAAINQNGYMAGVADQIEQCLKAQENDIFFQCAACTDLHEPDEYD